MAKRKIKTPFHAPMPIPSVFTSPHRFEKAGTRSGKKAAPAVVTESLQHGSILPARLAAGGTGCCTKKKGMKSCQGPPRPGMTELVFMRRPPKSGGPPAGPGLRFCTGKGAGVVLPVANPHDAKRVALAFDACVSGKRANTDRCIAEATQGAQTHLAGYGRRRRGRR